MLLALLHTLRLVAFLRPLLGFPCHAAAQPRRKPTKAPNSQGTINYTPASPRMPYTTRTSLVALRDPYFAIPSRPLRWPSQSSTFPCLVRVHLRTRSLFFPRPVIPHILPLAAFPSHCFPGLHRSLPSNRSSLLCCSLAGAVCICQLCGPAAHK
ncbi:hypothetical protein TRVL_06667 [Trypanosoma vivax]|nr:hypothetical protein TRVL_06667 [Trypanosoma vivax]